VHFPALLPREPYDASGRWTEYGDEIFRLKDRRENDFLLGPTHEEMFTLLVKDICTTYKDLPVSLYQIQTKYRDEARPRAGLLRGREFVMKDSYSFDLDDAGLQRSYDAHRAAYIRTFERLGLPYVIVKATSGAMGGSASEEFLAPLEIGEDTFVRCPSCGYAANVEAVEIAPSADEDFAGLPASAVLDTPSTPTIGSLVALLNERGDLRRDGRSWGAADTLKNILVAVIGADGTRTPLAIGLPGDRELDMKRLEAAVAPAVAEVFDEAEFARWPQLVKGYIGPGALGAARGIRYLVDPRVATGTSWVTGADTAGHHVAGLVAGRDFQPDGTIDVAEVRPGDPCPNCGEGLVLERAVEIGHIFQLGRKYAVALGLDLPGPDGKPITVTMGSYGIGVSRALAAVAESSLDERGLCWPREVAPAHVHLVVAGKDAGISAAAEQLAGELTAAGANVIFDDRTDVSVGVKFKDAELIGVPTIVVAGRGVADGVLELRDRRSGGIEDLTLSTATPHLLELVGVGA
jgi:prolyl-tRNA synthetase